MSAAISKEELEARLVYEREALAQSLEDLRARAKAELDLRTHVRERPSAWLAGALFVGIWIGARR
jgi:hypothetical protein